MTQTKTIRVMIADDHDLLRKGLRLAIASVRGMELVGEANSGSEAVTLCDRLRPDVLLMDLMMPEMDGITAIQHIHRHHPDVRIVALTSFVDDPLVQSALSAGAVSYLLKNIALDELAAAIRKSFEGEPVLSTEATQALINAATLPPPPQYDLTTREKEVLTMLVNGTSNQEIATTLNIGLSTVKKHVSSILRKLETDNRTEAVIIALKHKLTDYS